jgi:hypothetical protein
MPYTFRLDQFQIVSPRSGGVLGGTDTDFVSLTLKVGDRLFGTLTKPMGDVQEGWHPVGLEFANIYIDDAQTPICLNFLITNAGNAGDLIQARLAAAGDDLTGAALGGNVLGVALQPEAAILLAAEVQSFDLLLNILGRSCDGLVASAQVEAPRSDFDNQFAAGLHSLTGTVAFPGMLSQQGCGGNSLYNVTMTFLRTDDLAVTGPDPNSTFVIMNRSSGLVLDIPNAAINPGIQIQQFPENGGDNQKWRLVPVPGDNNWWITKIQSVSSGLVLDVEHSSNDNHARVLQWPDHGGRNQQWEFDLGQEDGAVNEGFLHFPAGPKTTFFKIRNRNSGKVLDVPASKSEANTLIQQYDDNNGFNQHWQLIRA